MAADDNRNLRLGFGTPEVPVVGDTMHRRREGLHPEASASVGAP